MILQVLAPVGVTSQLLSPLERGQGFGAPATGFQGFGEQGTGLLVCEQGLGGNALGGKALGDAATCPCACGSYDTWSVHLLSVFDFSAS